MLSSQVCSKARLSRDPRFDGQFFTAVKTTKIYCRSICPANAPKEKNVCYYASAIEAASAGYRPCLRCRPDSAPGSPAWKGINTTLERAIRLIGEGVLHEGSLHSLADRLGITDRYLRQLFKEHLGISPKRYALYQQCLFAKQLLHQTTIPITQVALGSGFNSIRRFNDCFRSQLNLTPSEVRKSGESISSTMRLQLHYRPPYDWCSMRTFFSKRVIHGVEWCGENSYGRTFEWSGGSGEFTATHIETSHCFDVEIALDKITLLKPVVNNIRRILDLDVDIHAVQHDLCTLNSDPTLFKKGLRLPGVWNVFEAGIRAILGQQITVAAAVRLLSNLNNTLGVKKEGRSFFLTPESLAQSELDFLKIPASKKQTLRNLALFFVEHENPIDPNEWLGLKGIGPWTANYAKLRGLSDPDIYLAGDVGVKKAVNLLGQGFNPDLASPWRSYLTLQLWNLL